MAAVLDSQRLSGEQTEQRALAIRLADKAATQATAAIPAAAIGTSLSKFTAWTA